MCQNGLQLLARDVLLAFTFVQPWSRVPEPQRFDPAVSFRMPRLVIVSESPTIHPEAPLNTTALPVKLVSASPGDRDGRLEMALLNAAQLLVGNQSARRCGSADAEHQCNIWRQSRARIAPLSSSLLCNFRATRGPDLSPPDDI
jgi:hypothetical protein